MLIILFVFENFSRLIPESKNYKIYEHALEEYNSTGKNESSRLTKEEINNLKDDFPTIIDDNLEVIPLEYNHNDDLYIKIVSKRRFIIKGLCIFAEEKFYLTEIYKDVTYDEFMSALDEVRDFGFDIADQDKYDKLKYENYLRVFSR